jgi:hypothetical protein
MGKRDYQWREAKKSRKDAKKVTAAEVLSSPLSVEVVKKRKKKRQPTEE